MPSPDEFAAGIGFVALFSLMLWLGCELCAYLGDQPHDRYGE